MKYVWKILNSKIFLLAVILVVALVAVNAYWSKFKTDDQLETYRRQLSGQLTQKEQELQQANSDLNILNSKLVSQQELADELGRENTKLDQEFEDFKRKHNLIIKSKDRTIARLQGQISGGNSDAGTTPNNGTAQEVCDSARENCTFNYSWEDRYGRFQLVDPDIFESGDESFTYSQSFRISGEVYEQQDGSLMTKRLTLNEVNLVNGGWVDIPGAKVEIVASDFKYHNPPAIETEWEWTDLFRLRGVAIASVSLFPDTGHLKLGLGLEFFNFEGFGINSHTAIDFTDLNSWEQRIGLAYSPKFCNLDLNFALSVSVGSPFTRFGQVWTFNTGVIFYLNN
jgi:hypothetical protein